MEIITLIENKEGVCGLQNEFGLSFLIKDEDKTFIFDTGKTGEFVKNADKLNINLKDVKDMVLSHSHFDHTGGVKTFTEKCNSDYTLHVNKTFFEEKHRITEVIHEFLGNNFNEKYLLNHGVKIHYLENNEYKISKNITLHTNFKSMNDFEIPARYYFRKIYDNYILDNMEDEIAAAVETEKGLLIICGCSHIGIANIVENIRQRTGKKIYGIAGGLHLTKASDERMEAVLNYFKETGIEFFAVSHCTGDKFIEKLKTITDNFIYNSTGNKIIID